MIYEVWKMGGLNNKDELIAVFYDFDIAKRFVDKFADYTRGPQQLLVFNKQDGSTYPPL